MSKSSRKNIFWLLMALLLTTGHLPAQAESPKPSSLVQSSGQNQSDSLEQKSAQLINLLAEEKFAEVIEKLSPELQPQWTPDKMKEIWEKLVTTTGPFQKELKTMSAETVNADLVAVTTQFEKTTGDFLITFNKNQEVIGIDFPKVEPISKISDEFVDALANNDFATARGYLHPFLKIEIFPQQVQEKWEQVIARTGPFKKRLPAEVKSGLTNNDADLVLVPIEFENVTAYMVIIFDQYKRIIGVDFPTPNQ